MIGAGFAMRKPSKALIAAWRKKTCWSAETAGRATPHIPRAPNFTIENKGKSASGGAARTVWSAATASPHALKNNVQTNTYERSERGLKIRFILPS
jgi:hypothetical protein